MAVLIRRSHNLNTSSHIAFDCETTGLNPWKGDAPFAVSACDTEGNTLYYEWPVDPFSRRVYPQAKHVDVLETLLSNPNIPKVFHNANFDIRMFQKYLKIKTQGRIEETTIAARVFNNLERSLELKVLSEKYLSIPKYDEQALGDIVKKLRFTAKKLNYKVATEWRADYWLPKHFDPQSTLCQEYAVKDAERTMLLWLLFSDGMDEQQTRHTYEEEMRLWPVFFEMEAKGVRINRKVLLKERAITQKRARLSEKKLYALAGGKFNIQSNAQLSKIIYARPNITPYKLNKPTKSGERLGSTNWKSLRYYKDDEFIRTLADYKISKKCINDFFDKYL